jgi:hypothetical protein
MRRNLTVLHLALAAFFFPVALMFAFTGGLYTLAIKGGYQDAARPVALARPLTPELAGLVTLAEQELKAAGEALPSGGAAVKKAGTSFELEWTGVDRDVVLRPTADPLKAELIVKDTGPWRHLVQLHKAKGSTLAKAISVAWAVGLVTILLSGLIMAWMAPAFRRLAIRATGAGLATFAAYLWFG